uniref:PH domain-containing protein n=1 Tax=Photinus pyralis TaxID=7054 RepID=A0A1Y1MLV0_PHOPY
MDKKFKLSVSNIAIDSDASAETNSLSAESTTTENVQHKTRKKFGRRRGSEWEVVEGLKEGQRFEKRPDVYNGFLHKKRKWPLKGWHKRYFILNKGILIYGKNPNEMNKGKIHGSVDVGLSVISSKLTGCRIDIDAEEYIYHLKAKTDENFTAWLKQLTDHRLFRQHGLTYGSKAGIFPSLQTTEESAEALLKNDCTDSCNTSKELSTRLSSWIKNVPLDDIERDIAQTEKNLKKLSHLLRQVDPKSGNASNLERISINSTCSTNLDVAGNFLQTSEPLDNQAYEKIYGLSKEVFSSVKNVVSVLSVEKDALKEVLNQESHSLANFDLNGEVITGLKNSLKEALHQNTELRRRLKAIHDTSDSSNISHLQLFSISEAKL